MPQSAGRRPSRPEPSRGGADGAERVPVWELHRRPLPVRVAGYAGAPDIIVCLSRSSGFVLDVEVVPAGAPPERSVQLFLRATQSASGLPHVVAVAWDDLASLLRRALHAMGVRAYPDLAALMRDAAAYYRAAPWELLDDDQILTARLRPEGSRRAAVVRYLSVLGGAGETFGLAVFHSLEGVRAVLDGDSKAVGRVAVTSVTFDGLDGVEQALKVRLCRSYEVAGPAAFPFFMRSKGRRHGRASGP